MLFDIIFTSIRFSFTNLHYYSHLNVIKIQYKCTHRLPHKKEILFKQVSLMCKIILFYYSKKTMRKYGHICEFKAGKFFFKYPIAFLNIAFNSL